MNSTQFSSINIASDLVCAALGSAGFVFEGGRFARYTRTFKGARATAWIFCEVGGSFWAVTESGDFRMSEAEILSVFPGPISRAICGERSAS